MSYIKLRRISLPLDPHAENIHFVLDTLEWVLVFVIQVCLHNLQKKEMNILQIEWSFHRILTRQGIIYLKSEV